MEPALLHVSPLALAVHPVLDGFPDLPPDQYAALKASIQAHGILDPLSALPSGHEANDPDLAEGELMIFDGRHRRRAAIELNLDTVPVITRNGIAPLDYAIERAVVGRQLTKSGVALMLFEKHPALAKHAATRKASGLKRGENSRGRSTTTESSDYENESYCTLSERYSIPKEYLVRLGQLRREVTDEDWQLIRQAILEQEISIPRIYAGQAGRTATKGAKKAPALYLTLDRQGRPRGIMPDAIQSLENGFDRWSTLDLHARGALKAQWDHLIEVIPADLRS